MRFLVYTFWCMLALAGGQCDVQARSRLLLAGRACCQPAAHNVSRLDSCCCTTLYAVHCASAAMRWRALGWDLLLPLLLANPLEHSALSSPNFVAACVCRRYICVVTFFFQQNLVSRRLRVHSVRPVELFQVLVRCIVCVRWIAARQTAMHCHTPNAILSEYSGCHTLNANGIAIWMCALSKSQITTNTLKSLEAVS